MSLCCFSSCSYLLQVAFCSCQGIARRDLTHRHLSTSSISSDDGTTLVHMQEVAVNVALTMSPDNDLALRIRGMLRGERGDFKGSLADVKHALTEVCVRISITLVHSTNSAPNSLMLDIDCTPGVQCILWVSTMLLLPLVKVYIATCMMSPILTVLSMDHDECEVSHAQRPTVC